MLDWNDIRYLVAVADLGSTLAAARALRVNQTTVARRLAALEAATGLILFDRHQAGYRLTPAAIALIGQARTLTDAAESFEAAARAEARASGGTIKLTTEDIFANDLLAPILVDLHSAHPAIRIELETSSALRDLGAGEAEIALRGTAHEPPAGVVGRRLCRNDWTLYCSREYAARHGLPRTKAELREHAIVGGGGGSLWRAYQAFLREHDLESQVAIHQPSSSGLLASVRSGFGVGVLPCIVADADPALVRCLPPKAANGNDLWLLTHDRVRHSPMVRTAIDFLYDRLKAKVTALALD